ncbi:MAG: hypothetical protein NDI61_05475, partial [Bdellovibrionaceae bacterium]|nr:hypothetical protein [Pseudobdellovibrionaceae bacterium]
YLRATSAKNRTGRLALVGLMTILLLIFFGSVFGPPPPSIYSVAMAGNLMWLFVILAIWVDRNRKVAQVMSP